MIKGLDLEDLKYFQTAFDHLLEQLESQDSESHVLPENEPTAAAAATATPKGPTIAPELAEALRALETDDHAVTWLPDPVCFSRPGTSARALDRDEKFGRCARRQRLGGYAGGQLSDELCVYHRTGSARTEGTYKVQYIRVSNTSTK